MSKDAELMKALLAGTPLTPDQAAAVAANRDWLNAGRW